MAKLLSKFLRNFLLITGAIILLAIILRFSDRTRRSVAPPGIAAPWESEPHPE